MAFLSWETPRTPRTPMTPFDLKFDELDDIKKDMRMHTSRISNLTLEYQDWFKQQRGTFISTVKHLLVALPPRPQPGISTIKEFRQLCQTFDVMKSSGRSIAQSGQTLKMFLDFWDRYCVIKAEIDEEVILRIDRYVESVSRLRQAEVKDHIDALIAQLNSKFSEEFNFRDLREKHKLYTFQLGSADYEYQGLVTYIPHLLNLTTQILYHSGKIHLEKE